MRTNLSTLRRPGRARETGHPSDIKIRAEVVDILAIPDPMILVRAGNRILGGPRVAARITNLAVAAIVADNVGIDPSLPYTPGLG
jgi:hypothetical protein